jgi:hypothetical protein
MSTDSHPINVVNTAPIIIANETAKTGKGTAVVAVISIFVERSACHGGLILEMRSLLAKGLKVPIFHKLRDISQIMKKGQILKKLAPKLKKIELNSTNSKLYYKKIAPKFSTRKPDLSIRYGLKVKNKTIRVLLDSGSSVDLLFVKKGSIKHISGAKWAVTLFRLGGLHTFSITYIHTHFNTTCYIGFKTTIQHKRKI